jgi:hypothetical protein
MPKPIKDTYVRVEGKMYIAPQEWENGKDVTLTLKGSIRKSNREDNEDGTDDICYVFKATEVQVK